MKDNQGFPFTTPAESEAEMFIQWKGTDVCVDFLCDCGRHYHLDLYFMYFVECECGQVYEMGTQVIAKKVEKPTDRLIINMAAESKW